jgi:hypothetical protein
LRENLTEFWNLPMAAKNFANYRIVGFLGNSAFAASVISRQIPSHDLHHSVAGILEVGNANALKCMQN